MARIEKAESGCWLWRGWRNHLGYGEMTVQGKGWRAHRLSFTLFKGKIPPGIDICHTCDNPPCVNPDHLWLGDQKANSRDIVVKGRNHGLNKTECGRGHPYAIFGRRHPRLGWRTCTICERGRQRTYLGWPEALAYEVPKQKLGYRPKSIAGDIQPKPLRGVIQNCKHGHPLSGGNLYVTPDGRRQCKKCRHLAVVRAGERQRQQFRDTPEHSNDR